MLSFDWRPDLFIFGGEFIAFSKQIGQDDYKEPLEESVDQVLAPSISLNFDVEGRPSWEPLAPSTVAAKGSNAILIASGEMATWAEDPGSWDISSTEAALVGGPDYAVYHQEGTSKMPARPFAVVQPDDMDDIENIFWDWLDRKFDSVVVHGKPGRNL